MEDPILYIQPENLLSERFCHSMLAQFSDILLEVVTTFFRNMQDQAQMITNMLQIVFLSPFLLPQGGNQLLKLMQAELISVFHCQT